MRSERKKNPKLSELIKDNIVYGLSAVLCCKMNEMTKYHIIIHCDICDYCIQCLRHLCEEPLEVYMDVSSDYLRKLQIRIGPFLAAKNGNVLVILQSETEHTITPERIVASGWGTLVVSLPTEGFEPYGYGEKIRFKRGKCWDGDVIFIF
jgi:hypothetical protein